MIKSRIGRWRSIQDLPIRSKQTLVLFLPTVALVVLAALLTTSSIEHGSQASRVSAATALVARVTDLTHELDAAGGRREDRERRG